MGADDRFSSLAAAFQGVAPASGRLPPVHLWNPTACGEIDIRIRRDGTWWHEGAPIARPALVRLFSSVLRRDPDGYWLVTPAEKLKITVEDAPFVAVALEREGGALRFTTNVGETVEAGPAHAIRVEPQGIGLRKPCRVPVRAPWQARRRIRFLRQGPRRRAGVVLRPAVAGHGPHWWPFEAGVDVRSGQGTPIDDRSGGGVENQADGHARRPDGIDDIDPSVESRLG